MQLQKYTGWSVEDAEAEEEKLAKGKTEFFKFAQGKNVLRFLPAPNGQKPFVSFYQHYLKKPDGSMLASFTCPARVDSKPCPACRRSKQLESSGSPADAEAAKSYWPSFRALAVAVDRSNPDQGPILVGFGKTVLEQLTAIRKNTDEDFTHPTEGFDIIINREGSGVRDTKYVCMPNRKSTPLHTDAKIMAEWLSSQPDVTRYTRVMSEQEIMNLVTGGGKGQAPPPVKQQRMSRSANVEDALDADYKDTDDNVSW